MVLGYVPYGLPPLLIAGTFLALGIAYDLGLKSTLAAAVVMGLAFPLLLLAWDLFAHVPPALLWTFPLWLALGAAIHLADALPDAAVDRATGARGLTQLLGERAIVVEWLLLAGGNMLVLALALAGVTSARASVLVVMALLSVAALLVCIGIARQQTRPEGQRLRANFILSVLIALVTGFGWLISAIV